jgi:hypothetical protein
MAGRLLEVCNLALAIFHALLFNTYCNDVWKCLSVVCNTMCISRDQNVMRDFAVTLIVKDQGLCDCISQALNRA